MRLILASGSPRRKELLDTLTIPYEVISADIDETIDEDGSLRDEIEALSFKKALAVFEDHRDACVIGADTIVTIDGKRLGKPKDENEAFMMLKELSGRTHDVITAVSIISPKMSETFSSVSMVTFYEMSDDEIKDYIATKEPLDKAGSYAIQGIGSRYIKGIIGDYYAIMGLPIAEVYHRILKHLI